MEILEAFDLTQSFRDAGELAGCDHHTVARYVDDRQAGEISQPSRREQLIYPFPLQTGERGVKRKGKVRGDAAPDTLVPRDYAGCGRTTPPALTPLTTVRSAVRSRR